MDASNLLHSPDFCIYVFCAALLMAKMFGLAAFTGITRGKHKTTPNVEDRGTSSPKDAAISEVEHPDVQRAQRAHRNDLENIPLFLITGLIAVLAGVQSTALTVLLVAFTLARFLHSVAYVRKLQPWRAIGWLTGVAATVVLMGFILARVWMA